MKAPILVHVFLDVKPIKGKYRASWYDRGVPGPAFYATKKYATSAEAVTAARAWLAKHNAFPEDAWVYKETAHAPTVYVDTTRNPERFGYSLKEAA